MNPVARLIGYSALLLALFLVAVIGGQSWLGAQTERLRNEAIAAKRQQLLLTAALVPPAAASAGAGNLLRLGEAAGVTLALVGQAPPPPATSSGVLRFVENLPDGRRVLATFTLTPGARLISSQHRLTLALTLLGTLVVAIIVLLLGLTWRQFGTDRSANSPWAATRAEMGPLEHLAKTSAAQHAALGTERDNRRRAEADLALKVSELNRSLEEKVRLGRDLHDGLIQSLYALGLTLESVRALLATDPAEADRRLVQCASGIDASIRDVRAYISGLAPDHLVRAGFAHALEASLAELRAGRDVTFDIKIDEDAALLLGPDQITETLQIAREAVSNSLRHGGASLINVRVHQIATEVCLLVQDNGTGFDASLRTDTGRGLDNMQARAARLGAQLRLTSEPGHGARLVLTLPVAPAAPA